MENEKLRPLYKKLKPCCDDYTCMATGNKCDIATKYFLDFRKAVEYMAKNKQDFDFVTRESNLCMEQKCPVWSNALIKMAEFARQNTK